MENIEKIQNKVVSSENYFELELMLDGEMYQMQVTRLDEGFSSNFRYVLLKDGRKSGSAGLIHYNKGEKIDQVFERKANDIYAAESFFLDTISVKTKSHGIGTAFLNHIIGDIEAYNHERGIVTPLFFFRADSEETIPFYAKFGAKRFDGCETVETSSGTVMTPMIIEVPHKTQGKEFSFISGNGCKKDEIIIDFE